MQLRYFVLGTLLFLQSSICNMPAKGARILALFYYNGKSHYIIFETLLKALVKRGHHVYVVSHFPQKEPMENYTDISVKGTVPDLVNNFTFEVLKSINHLDVLKFLWWTLPEMCHAAATHPPVVKLLNSNETFDLIITEILAPDCFLEFLHKYNAPVINIITNVAYPWGNDRVGNPDNPAYIPGFYTPFTERMSFWERFISLVTNEHLKLGHNWFGESNLERMSNNYFGYDSPPHSELRKKTSLVLVNSHFSLNYPRPNVPAFVEIGGLHIQESGKLPHELETFINEAKHGAIYFNLGSLVRGSSLPPEKVQAFINVFRNIPQRVLWKTDLNMSMPPNIITSNWFPQFEILSHPNVRAFITHGGLLGVEEAVYREVPMVAIPIFADQELNVKNCVEKGIAIKIDYYSISTETLSTAINQILYNTSFKKNINEVSKIFRDRPQTPLETAIFWTEYVIRHKGASHLRSAAVDLPLYQYLLLDVIAFLLLAITAVFTLFVFIFRRIFKILPKKKLA